MWRHYWTDISGRILMTGNDFSGLFVWTIDVMILCWNIKVKLYMLESKTSLEIVSQTLLSKLVLNWFLNSWFLKLVSSKMNLYWSKLMSKIETKSMVLVLVSVRAHNWFWLWFCSSYDVCFGFGFAYEQKINLNWFWFCSWANQFESVLVFVLVLLICHF